MAEVRIKAVVLGASGYTGAELVRLLLVHPSVEIVALAADRRAGKPIGEVFPHLAMEDLPTLVALEEISWEGVDVVFCCLPHATTQEVVKELPTHLKVIDLSADFRLRDPKLYAEWYEHSHQAEALQKEAVYGLPEWYRDAVSKARIIACPGCYPTATLLPLLPLLEEGIVEKEGIVVDAKSGVSGAGRTAKESSLFSEVAEGMAAYGVGRHRHMPEIEQTLTEFAGSSITIDFTPHLVPMNRGILATTYAKLAKGKQIGNARMALEKRYAQEPFVHVLPEGQVPATRHVRGSNHCVIGLAPGRSEGRLILVSAIDNLVKGASGQAVQNMNLAFGLDEKEGLRGGTLFP